MSAGINLDSHHCAQGLSFEADIPVVSQCDSFCPMEVDELEVMIESIDDLSTSTALHSVQYIGLQHEDYSLGLYRPPTLV